MNPLTPPTDAPQSFVIRVWHESPRKWRGSVRHVQSEAQRGFERLDQANRFIEQRIAVPPLETVQKARRISPLPQMDWSWLGARRLQPVWALGGLALLLVVTLVVVNPNVRVPLSGAAIGRGDEFQMVSAFMGGAILGGLGVAWWCRSKSH